MGGTPYSDICLDVLDIISPVIDNIMLHETILTYHQCGFREYLRKTKQHDQVSCHSMKLIIICYHVLNLPRLQSVPMAYNHPATSAEQTGVWYHQMKHFRVIGPLCGGIIRSPVNSPHKGQWCGALMFSLICAWINGWVKNRGAGDLGRHRAYYDVTVIGKSVIWRSTTVAVIAV